SVFQIKRVLSCLSYAILPGADARRPQRSAASLSSNSLNTTLVCRLSNRVALRLDDGERRSGGVDLAQDVFALGFPHVAPRILIAACQEGDDGVGQFSGRGKALFGNELGEVAKEALDQIHPG